MTNYLIEYAIDGERSAALMDADGAARFLRASFHNASCCWTPFEVVHLSRYEDGALVPLHLQWCGEGHVDENDYIHYSCEVWASGVPTSPVPEFEFTAMIDGRA